MTSKIILFAAAGGIVLATGASALPLNPLRGDNSVGQAHVVCDEYGRCWEVSDDPGRIIIIITIGITTITIGIIIIIIGITTIIRMTMTKIINRKPISAHGSLIILKSHREFWRCLCRLESLMSPLSAWKSARIFGGTKERFT